MALTSPATDASLSGLAPGWAAIGLLEALPDQVAERYLKAWLQREVAHARATLEPLPRWSSIPEQVYAISTATPNHVRARRVLDYVLPGERVIDIGVNYGYLSGLILRERRPEHYAGYDLSQHQLDSVQTLVDELELSSGSIALAIGDVYELEARKLAQHRASLVLLTEVLEHVPDAERALATVAAALPEGASLLLTVPLFGRHDTCWGHRSVFDAARVRAMCEGAELAIQCAEAVHNRWLFVLASRREEANALRLASLAESGWPQQPPALVREHSLALINRRSLHASRRWCVRLADAPETERQARHGITVSGRGAKSGERSYVGVRVRLPGFHLVRLELSVRGRGVTCVIIDAQVGRERVARWRWDRAKPTPEFERTMTLVLRDGEPAGPFVAVEQGDLSSVDALEIFAEIKGRGQASVAVLRGAVLPAASAARDA